MWGQSQGHFPFWVWSVLTLFLICIKCEPTPEKDVKLLVSAPVHTNFSNVFLSGFITVPPDYEFESEEDLSPSTEPPPTFAQDNSQNVTVHLGSTAFLHCKVSLLNDKTVSWVKHLPSGEVLLLTFGLHTYSNDQRLSINFEQPNNWKLRIFRVEEEDASPYACQVSSHPPTALLVTLSVIIPQIRIVDDLGRNLTDKYYNAGSTLELRCVITNLPPSYTILWKHGNRTLNYDASRGGISVKTTIRKEEAVSVLYIANAKANDSGPYICSLANLTQATVLVHVMIGETPAAMQHSNYGESLLPPTFTVFLALQLFPFFEEIINYQLKVFLNSKIPERSIPVI